MSTPLVAVIALVAALLGALAGRAYEKNQRRRKKRRTLEVTSASIPIATDEGAVRLRQQLGKLQQENADLTRRTNELEYQLRKRAAQSPKLKSTKAFAPATVPAPAAVPPAEAASEVAAPPAPTVLYASAVPGGYLADAQLAVQAMGRMPLAVCPDPAEPTRATFTLSPEVDQSWLIEAGLDRLRDYFDYEPPTGWPNTVAATAAGQLRREGEGWRVAPGGKGRLDVR